MRCRHSCPGWGYIMIDEGDPEFSECRCFKAIRCASCGSVGHYSQREIDTATARCWVCKRPHVSRFAAAIRAAWRWVWGRR